MRRHVLLSAVLVGLPPAAGMRQGSPGTFRCPLMELMLRVARARPGIVVDVGANGGCEMDRALKAGRKVIGVECLASAYHELQEPPIGVHPNATLLLACASNVTGIVELNLANDSSSMIERNVPGGGESRKRPRTGRLRQPVVALPLDTVLSPAQRVAIIKIDVQGFEGHVLTGALRTIAKHAPFLYYEDSMLPAMAVRDGLDASMPQDQREMLYGNASRASRPVGKPHTKTLIM